MLFFIFLIIVFIIAFCVVKALISSNKARKITSKTIDYADKFNSIRNFYHDNFDSNKNIKSTKDIYDVDVDVDPNDINFH